MPGTTPIYSLPYPVSSDLVSAYPALGQDLAEDLDDILAAKWNSKVSDTAPSTPAEGDVWVDTTGSTTIPKVYTGSAWQSMAGKILQVVSTSKDDTFTTTSTSFTDVTGLSVTITPSATTSKILITAAVTVGVASASNGFIRLVRGSTAIFIGNDTAATQAAGEWKAATNAAFANSDPLFIMTQQVPITYLDSPSTTSATTYKIQACRYLGTVYINRGNSTGSTWVGSFASSITAMEVAA